MLYDPARHEELTATPWSDNAAADGIARTAEDAVGGFDPDALWPTHPMDEPQDADPYCMLYFGATGVIYALRRLAAAGTPFTLKAFAPTVATLLERNRARTREWDADVPSLRFGDVGILLLQWQWAPSGVLADAIFGAVERTLRNPTLEQLWGSPGTLPAAIHMFEWTGERRWSDLLTRGVAILWEQAEHVPEARVWLWTQDLYGRTLRLLGGCHGFAGNVFPALRGAHMLPSRTGSGGTRCGRATRVSRCSCRAAGSATTRIRRSTCSDAAGLHRVHGRATKARDGVQGPCSAGAGAPGPASLRVPSVATRAWARNASAAGDSSRPTG